MKKMWMDAHNAIGVVSLPFHLMFALTGFLLSVLFMLPGLYEYVTPTKAPIEAYQEFGGHGDREGRRGDRTAPARAAMLPPARLVGIASAQLSDFTPLSISYSSYGTTEATATVNGRVRGALGSEGSVSVSAVTGKVSNVDSPASRPTPRSIERGYSALHYGDFGGEILRALYFVMGLGGAVVFYSGNLLWIETKRKRRHVAQTRGSWLVAQMTIGVCLGSCLGIGMALLGSRLLSPALIEAGWQRHLYFVGFFFSLVWSFGRVPIRAAIEILSGCAIAYVSLPIVNGITSPENIFVSLTTGLWDVALIDSVFLSLGIFFGLAARYTFRRANHGQPNSVWSLDALPERRAVPLASSSADRAHSAAI